MIICVLVILVQRLPAYVCYTHMRVHIHNYADKILCATCYKRPPILGDLLLGWRGSCPRQVLLYSNVPVLRDLKEYVIFTKDLCDSATTTV